MSLPRLRWTPFPSSSFRADGGRVCLPSSFLNPLTREHDFSSGPVLLSLRFGSAHTFSGVAEFNAPEGTIIVPSSVIDALSLSVAPSSAPWRCASTTCPAPELSAPDASVCVVCGSPRADDGESLDVSIAKLPYATSLSLRPLTPDVADEVSDVEAWLTRSLPEGFSVLSVGQILRLRGAHDVFEFLVTDVAPADAGAVCIADTNVALSISPPDEAAASGPRARVRALEFDAPLNARLGPGEVVRLRVPRKAGDAGAALNAVFSMDAPVGVCAFISRPPNTRPSVVLHEWGILSGGRRALSPDEATPWPGEGRVVDERRDDGSASVFFLRLENTSLDAHADISLCLSSPAGAALAPEFALAAQGAVKPPDDASRALGIDFDFASIVDAMSPAPGAVLGDGEAQCRECGQHVPAISLVMHELGCARRKRESLKCPVCSILVPLKIAHTHAHCGVCTRVFNGPSAQPHADAHASVVHGDHSCPWEGCRVRGPLADVHMHALAVCVRRRITCRFCGDVVAAGGRARDAVDTHAGLGEHEAACGSRTRTCVNCVPRRAIRLKEWVAHVVSAHGESPSSDAALVRGRAGSRSSRGSVADGAADEDALGRAVEDSLSDGRAVGETMQDALPPAQRRAPTSGFPAPPVPPRLRTGDPCANHVCAEKVMPGNGRVLGLCGRCELLVTETPSAAADESMDGSGSGSGGGAAARETGVGDAQDRELVRSLALVALEAAYARARSRGCTVSGCRNPVCFTSGARSVPAADVLVRVAISGGGVWLCVPTAQKLLVQQLPVSILQQGNFATTTSAVQAHRSKTPASDDGRRARIAKANF